MDSITLPPITNNYITRLDTSPKQKIDSPGIQQIDKKLNAEGRTKVGEKALEESLKKLSEVFHSRNIQVSTVFEAQQGLKQIKITDAITGKSIIEMPPEVVVHIADKAKQRHIGWLIDLVT